MTGRPGFTQTPIAFAGGRLGSGFGRGGLFIKTILSVLLAAPAVTWSGIATDTTPDFTLDLPVDTQAGDVVRIQYRLAASDWSSPTTYLTYTITSADLLGLDNINVSGITAPGDGSYDFRSRLERSGVGGSWSTDVAVLIDSTAPTITSSSTFSQAENSAFSQQLTASESATWTKTGGSDGSLFALTSGGLLTMTARDFENPGDSDVNNTYVVNVAATDPSGNVGTQTITVTITNVADVIVRQVQLGSTFINISAGLSRQEQLGSHYINEG